MTVVEIIQQANTAVEAGQMTQAEYTDLMATVKVDAQAVIDACMDLNDKQEMVQDFELAVSLIKIFV